MEASYDWTLGKTKRDMQPLTLLDKKRLCDTRDMVKSSSSLSGRSFD